jgi:VanZ like family
MTRWSRGAVGGLLLLCVAGVLAIAFGPFGPFLDRLTIHLHELLGNRLHIAPHWVTAKVYGRALNVAFFVPVGVLLAWWFGALWGWAVPLAVALSVLVEAGQWALPSLGRDPDLGDIACNAVGACIGAVVVAIWRPRPGD